MNDLSLLSEVEFSSFLNYSPRGTSPTARKSQSVKDLLKNCSPPERLEAMVKTLAERVPGSPLEPFLNPQIGLVPTPRASQLKEGALWPAKTLCDLLVKYKLGAQVYPIIERHTTIRTSKSSPGNRPEPPEHLATLDIKNELVSHSSITVIDDIITKGATLLASASLVAKRFPSASIRCFAFQRTRGLQDDIDQLIEIVAGKIRYEAARGYLFREP